GMKVQEIRRTLLVAVLLTAWACNPSEGPASAPPGDEQVTAEEGKILTELKNPPEVPTGASPEVLYKSYCSPCHDLALVQAQRLDRATWQWVMDDMINDYGLTWITKEEQKIIVDYLAENFGQEKKWQGGPR
ncbi:MAG: hypothetical protein O6952_01285, partial [Planctomycetota bacterium]|nr:hypothetical protein [Planctomycetota bacterium]